MLFATALDNSIKPPGENIVLSLFASAKSALITSNTLTVEDNEKLPLGTVFSTINIGVGFVDCACIESPVKSMAL